MTGRLTDLGQLETALGRLPSYQGLHFSAEQAEAITANPSPVVVVAGAGTGKTTVMAARVAWLVGRGWVEPPAVLGLTFTRQAARRLAADIQAMLRAIGLESSIGPTVATYDAFAGSLLADYGALAGKTGWRLITGAEPYLIAQDCVRSFAGPAPRLGERALTSVVRALVGLDAQLQAHLVSVAAAADDARKLIDRLDQAPLNRNHEMFAELVDARAVAEERLELLGLMADYRQAKRDLGVESFADQMAQAVALAERFDQIGRDVRQRFQAVLLDEYQDTSGAQTRLLSRLFGAAGQVAGLAVTAVGDPQQAIYSWRGAAVDSILHFHRDFPPAGQPAHRLTVNRRSGQPILDTANRLTAAGCDRLVPADLRLALTAADHRPGRVDAVECISWAESCAWLADDIVSNLASGQAPTMMAVLVRRRAQLPDLYQAMADCGIPVAVAGLAGLLAVPAIAQVVALLELAADPTNNQAALTILTGPRFRLSPDDLARLGARARHLADASRGTADPAVVSLAAALADPGAAPYSPRVRAACRQVHDDLTAIGSTRGSVAQRLLAVISHLGLDVEALIAGNGVADQVNQFLDAVAGYAAAGTGSDLTGLLAWLEAAEQYDDGLARVSAGSDAVVLSTVHQAKGLEWDTVYLPGLVDGVFPEARLRDNPIRTAAALPTAIRSDAASLDQIGAVTKAGLTAYADDLKQSLAAAEDRLAYVAMTRAKSRLVGLCHHREPGRVRPTVPSRYFDIIAQVAATAGSAVTLAPDCVPAAAAGPVEPVDWPEPDNPQLAAAAQAVWRAMAPTDSPINPLPRQPDGQAADRVAGWDRLIAQLNQSSQPNHVVEVALPSPLSASRLLEASRDPASLVARWVRPRPVRPNRQAERGARFHAWVQSYYSTATLPGISGIKASQPEIADLTEAFLASDFADARPLAVEWDFTTTLADQVVTGRVDAVFARADNPGLVPADATVLVVDWKTGGQPPDPRQLGLYALAWSRASGQPLDSVASAFVDWPRGRITLSGRLALAELESWLTGLAD